MIVELAERVSHNLWDESASSTKDFEEYLWLAERYRKEGNAAAEEGDCEHAFVVLGKAATLLLEKLPMHCAYQRVLTAPQRINLSLVHFSIIGCDLIHCFRQNGQDILDLIAGAQEHTRVPLRGMATETP